MEAVVAAYCILTFHSSSAATAVLVLSILNQLIHLCNVSIV